MKKQLISAIIAFLVILYFNQSVNVKAKENPEVIVLMYHHLLEEKDMYKNGCIISVENFRDQMDYLYQSGYKTITVSELENFLYENGDIPEKSILITFDDGYLSNYIYAYPILKEYGFKATVFPVTSNILLDPQEFDPKTLVKISMEEILESNDVFEFGSHTHNMHYKENEVSHLIMKDKNEIIKDLLTSRFLLGNTNFFAYPYGSYTDETISLLKETGFKLAFTTKPGKVTRDTNPYEIHRYAIFPWTSLNKFKGIVD